MKKPLFTGVCTALVTPFSGDQIHYPMLEILLQRQLEAGIPAVVIAGTTGESPTLSDAEKINLYRHSKEYVGDQCLIIAGTGSNNTNHAIELSQAAQEAGVDGLLVVSPYYNKATPDGLYLHYKAIAESVSLPMILYNVPGRTGVDIPVSVCQALAKLPSIAGIKEASNDITKIARIRRACGDSLPIWSGNDDQIVPVMALGGCGVISVLSNVYPSKAKEICDVALAGNFPKAAKLQYQYLPLIDLLFCEVNPIPVKAVMKALGYDCGECRLPLCSLSQEKLERISQILQ